MSRRNPVYSYDPAALTKLQAELVQLEGRQATMKAVNAAIKKHGNSPATRTALAEMGYTEGRIEQLLKGDFMGRTGYPPFELSNNSANIRRIKERVQTLQRAAA